MPLLSISFCATDSSRDDVVGGLPPKRRRSPGDVGSSAWWLEGTAPGLTCQSRGMPTTMPPGPVTSRYPGGIVVEGGGVVVLLVGVAVVGCRYAEVEVIGTGAPP